MKYCLIIFFLFALSFSSYAQNADISANYEQAARFSPAKLRELVYSTEVVPNWINGSDCFWYSYKTTQGTEWYIVNPKERTKQLLFNRVLLAESISKLTNIHFDADKLNLQNIYFLADNKTVHFEASKGKIYTFQYNLSTKEVIQITDATLKKPTPAWASFSPDTTRVYYSKGYNLFWMDYENYIKAFKNERDTSIIEHQITSDGQLYYSWGVEPFSLLTLDEQQKEEELRKRKPVGLVWSPDSKHFAISRKDDRGLKDLWVIHSLIGNRPKLETYKYQMPGEKDETEVELYIFDIATHNPKRINISAYKNQTLTLWDENIKKGLNQKYSIKQWLGDKNEFYLTRASRDLKRVDLLSINLNGNIKPLIQEQDSLPISFKKPWIVQDKDYLVHWSERSGWGHFYLYNKDGKLLKQLTNGDYHADEITAYDSKNKKLFFKANGKEKGIDPYYTFDYSVSIDGGSPKLLTKGNFDHQTKYSPSNQYIVDNYSRVNTAPRSALYDSKGNVILYLEEADLSKLFASGYKFPEPFSVKAADSITDLYGVLYKPFNFDSTKTYPIIENVYPGPHNEAVNKIFSLKMDRTDRLAQMGFIVVTVGNRGGHPSRSKWYHTFGYGNLRDYGLADKKTTVEQLATRYAFIDTSKVGITGHSGGGFMAAAAILTYPDFYKVAVSEAGNHDNNMYNRVWGESFQGVKEIVKNNDTTFNFQVETTIALAKNLKGKLMIATGDVDNNVHPAHSIRLANALIREKKRFDFVLLPGQSHVFGSAGEYFFWQLADYFSENLLGSSKNNEADITDM